MQYEAVIFDLYGTLVDNYTPQSLERLLKEMADVLGIAQQDFIRVWNVETWPLRVIGKLATVEDVIDYIGDTLHAQVGEQQVQQAAALRLAYSHSMLVPRGDVVETLTRLRATGHKTGLISDCSSETPQLWPHTPLAALFDAAIFSCEVGMQKPDPQIYRLACTELGVSPEHCLYVGDGGSRELQGALAAGMHAVMITVPHEAERHKHRNASWQGPRISSIKEVLPLVESSPSV